MAGAYAVCVRVVRVQGDLEGGVCEGEHARTRGAPQRRKRGARVVLECCQHSLSKVHVYIAPLCLGAPTPRRRRT